MVTLLTWHAVISVQYINFDLHYSWRSQAGPHESIPCPPAQCANQKYMGGVDLNDQILQSFSVICKSKKAWKKTFVIWN